MYYSLWLVSFCSGGLLSGHVSPLPSLAAYSYFYIALMQLKRIRNLLKKVGLKKGYKRFPRMTVVFAAHA
jgi:hypothetical protein